MKVLVTGGAGFIGSNFVRRIIDGAYKGFSEVTVLDNLTYAGNRANLPLLSSSDFILGDVCNPELVSELLSRHDTVINFAAESHVDRSISDPPLFLKTNSLGPHTLLEAAKKQRIKHFIQVSTDEVYGSIETGSFIESDPLLPNSPYAASKASADLIARSYFRTFGLDVRITRSSNTFGPNQFPEKIIPLFITNLIEGQKVPIYGTGLNSRDWIHVDDHCLGIYKVLMNGRPGEIYNIGGGTELSNIDLTKLILEMMDKDLDEIRFVEDRLGHDFRYSINTEKIKKELEYSPSSDFNEDLESTINWYKLNQNWWKPLKS
jgi:dTDP-glucose 4,6-dehydratase